MNGTRGRRGDDSSALRGAIADRALRSGDVRRHLRGLAELSFTGCFSIEGPVGGSFYLHDGSIWLAERIDQIHLLSWLRGSGFLPNDESEIDFVSPGSTLREVASKDTNLDLSIIEARVYDYVVAETAALLLADSGRAQLIRGDLTDARFVSTWDTSDVLDDADRRCAVPLVTDVQKRATADLYELGLIVES